MERENNNLEIAREITSRFLSNRRAKLGTKAFYMFSVSKFILLKEKIIKKDSIPIGNGRFNNTIIFDNNLYASYVPIILEFYNHITSKGRYYRDTTQVQLVDPSTAPKNLEDAVWCFNKIRDSLAHNNYHFDYHKKRIVIENTGALECTIPIALLNSFTFFVDEEITSLNIENIEKQYKEYFENLSRDFDIEPDELDDIYIRKLSSQIINLKKNDKKVNIISDKRKKDAEYYIDKVIRDDITPKIIRDEEQYRREPTNLGDKKNDTFFDYGKKTVDELLYYKDTYPEYIPEEKLHTYKIFNTNNINPNNTYKYDRKKIITHKTNNSLKNKKYPVLYLIILKELAEILREKNIKNPKDIIERNRLLDIYEELINTKEPTTISEEETIDLINQMSSLLGLRENNLNNYGIVSLYNYLSLLFSEKPVDRVKYKYSKLRVRNLVIDNNPCKKAELIGSSKNYQASIEKIQKLCEKFVEDAKKIVKDTIENEKSKEHLKYNRRKVNLLIASFYDEILASFGSRNQEILSCIRNSIEHGNYQPLNTGTILLYDQPEHNSTDVKITIKAKPQDIYTLATEYENYNINDNTFTINDLFSELSAVIEPALLEEVKLLFNKVSEYFFGIIPDYSISLEQAYMQHVNTLVKGKIEIEKSRTI